MILKPRSSFVLFLSLAVAAGSLSAQDAAPQRMKGMAQQIVVRKAAELHVLAPSGDFVAVLDQSVAQRDPKASKVMDHNNGWLQLAAGELGAAVTVKGQYFIPIDATQKPTAFRFTVRKQTKAGLLIYAERTFKLETTQPGQWVDFTAELPVKSDATLSEPGGVFLMMSALPLAGPVYLDDVSVTSASGTALWAYPSFE